MNINDFKNIDFNNAGSLPWPVKGFLLTVLLGLVVAGGAWFVWKPTLETLQAAVDEEWGPDKNSGLRATFESKLAVASKLDEYKKQLKDAEQKSSVLLKQLPDKSEMDGLLTDINQAGIGRGLEFELFRPGEERPSALYAEMPIKIKVTGDYHDLGSFAADVAKMPRIVTLSEIVISSPGARDIKGGVSRLSMDAVAKTFRSLDKNDAPAPGKKVVGKKGKP